MQSLPDRLCGQTAPKEWHFLRHSWENLWLLLDTGNKPDQAKLVVEYRHYTGEDMTYTLKSGVIENSGLPRSTERGAAAQKIIISPVDLAPGSSLSLYFVYFHLGNFVNETCQDQRMEIHDGNASSRILASLCGVVNPNPVFSSGGQLTIVLPGSPTWTHAWYWMVYMTSTEGAGCGGNLTAYGGALSSPGYPEPFRRHKSCRWFIGAPPLARLTLQFSTFAFTSSRGCNTNYVEVYEGHLEIAERRLTRLCGQDQPAVFRSVAERVLVKMVTAEDNNLPGFYATFVAETTGERSHVGFLPHVG